MITIDDWMAHHLFEKKIEDFVDALLSVQDSHLQKIVR